MQDVDAATAELERAVHELGLVAPYVGVDYGFELDDPRLDDFYRTLVALDVPLFLHPASSGGEGPPDDRRLRRFDLSLLLGYAYDETLAVAALVFGGVLDRHPDVDICVSHGGGAITFLLERFELVARTRPWVPEELRDGGFTARLRRLWFDSHVDGHAARATLVEAVGTERLVYGTNFGGWDSAHREASEPFVQGLTGNAERLLRLVPAAAPSAGTPDPRRRSSMTGMTDQGRCSSRTPDCSTAPARRSSRAARCGSTAASCGAPARPTASPTCPTTSPAGTSAAASSCPA